MSQEIAKRLLFGCEPGPNGCIERPGIGPNSYYRVRIDGRSFAVHRVVWVAAYGPIPDGLYVCHRCDNRRCVNIDHLFLGTPADNVHDMLRKHRGLIGTKNGSAKLSPDDVRSVRQALAGGESQNGIARRFRVDQSAISLIKHKRTWGHLVD